MPAVIYIQLEVVFRRFVRTAPGSLQSCLGTVLRPCYAQKVHAQAKQMHGKPGACMEGVCMK